MTETTSTPRLIDFIGDRRRCRLLTDEGLLTWTTSMLSTLEMDDRDGLSKSFGFSCWCWVGSLVEVFPSSVRFLRGERCCCCCCCRWDSGSSSPIISHSFISRPNEKRSRSTINKTEIWRQSCSCSFVSDLLPLWASTARQHISQPARKAALPVAVTTRCCCGKLQAPWQR